MCKTSSQTRVRAGAHGPAVEVFEDLFDQFMKPFMVHLNPLMHSTEWQGRRFTENQVIVVTCVSRIGPVSPSKISKIFRLQKGSLTTVIAGLCDQGLIERVSVPGDERSYHLVLTRQGEAFISHMKAQREAGFLALFSEMPIQDLVAVCQGFSTLNKYLEARADEGR